MASQEKKPDPRLISYLTLRKAVGWLGISLPPALIVCNYIFANCLHIQDSISHYYYTIASSLFVAILCSDALFLIAYKGYDKWDNRTTNCAGIFALGIAFFPTNDSSADSCAIFHLPDSGLRHAIHLTSAGLFFIILACISLFLFTKSKGQKTREKRIRNKVYRVCGVVILICVTLIALYLLGRTTESGANRLKPIFWLETTALLAFGTSWLVKGEFVLEDEP